MMRTPDGHGRLALSRFLAPLAVTDHRNAPVNALGYLRVMFAVDDIDETLTLGCSTPSTGSKRSAAPMSVNHRFAQLVEAVVAKT